MFVRLHEDVQITKCHPFFNQTDTKARFFSFVGPSSSSLLLCSPDVILCGWLGSKHRLILLSCTINSDSCSESAFMLPVEKGVGATEGSSVGFPSLLRKLFNPHPPPSTNNSHCAATNCADVSNSDVLLTVLMWVTSNAPPTVLMWVTSNVPPTVLMWVSSNVPWAWDKGIIKTGM